MATDTTKTSATTADNIDTWWSAIMDRRQFSETIRISRLLKKVTPEEQTHARHLIANKMRDSIVMACDTRNMEYITSLCSALNGCFDNFPLAMEAVNESYNELIRFFDLCLDECGNVIFDKSSAAYDVLKIFELLHTVSRVLLLMLKLRRPVKCKGPPVNSVQSIDDSVKVVLTGLSTKIGKFLLVDRVFMDTKCNLVASTLLLREIGQQKSDLIKYHGKLVKSLNDRNGYQSDVDVYKLLLTNAVLNMWCSSVVPFTQDTIEVYLRFYIRLCEKYSSVTETLLLISRSFMLLVKYIADKENFCSISYTVKSLSCVWMILDHPVACIRHSGKDFLEILAKNSYYKEEMRNALRMMPPSNSFYETCKALLKNSVVLHDDVEMKILQGLHGPHSAHACSVLENVPAFLSSKYYVYVLNELSRAEPPAVGNIEKCLEIILLKKIKFLQTPILRVTHSNSNIHSPDNTRWAPRNDGELISFLIQLKLMRKHGGGVEGGEVEWPRNEKSGSSKWKGMVDMELMKECLQHKSDRVRLEAFSSIIQGQKTTEVYTNEDMLLILHFLKYNLNNNRPATRQKILCLMKKMVQRFSQSLAVLMRQKVAMERKEADEKQMSDIESLITNYHSFWFDIQKLCFSSIFPGANYNRLNTVLSILLFMKDVDSVKSGHMFYFNKIVQALESPYEENKKMAAQLAKKMLNESSDYLRDSKPKALKQLFERGLDLCGRLEPPNVLTGTYIVQALIEEPSIREVMRSETNTSSTDLKLLCIKSLADRLRDQVVNGEKNLFTAAVSSPMYGLLFGIRSTFQEVDLSEICHLKDEVAVKEWSGIINDVIDLAFRMIRIVGNVVNSSSPEGHLPSDFQCANGLALQCGQPCELSENEFESEVPSENIVEKATEDDVTPIGLLKLEENLNVILMMMEHGNIPWIFNKLCSLPLIKSALSLGREKCLVKNPEYELIFEMEDQLRDWFERCKNSRNLIPTAQILLLCAWRSMKEACLFFGDVVSKLSLEKMIETNLITEEKVLSIGEELRKLLCEIKHRGAFEQAYIGFNQVLTALWKCPLKHLNELPKKWLKEVIDEIDLPEEERSLKFCWNRRSAGLPFFFQSIITTEAKETNSGKLETLDYAINAFCRPIGERAERKYNEVHSMNILRAILKESSLCDYVAPYIPKVLSDTVLRCGSLEDWSYNNSASLLFSALYLRMFGVVEKNSESNKMTTSTFVRRYGKIFERFCLDVEKLKKIYLLLLIERLRAPKETYSTSYVILKSKISRMAQRDSYMKVRELAAQVYAALIAPTQVMSSLKQRFSFFTKFNISQINPNCLHGILLQIKEISNRRELDPSLKDEAQIWIKNSSWILSKRVSFIIKVTYLQALHSLFKVWPSLRYLIRNILKKAMSRTNRVSHCRAPGSSLYLETLYFVLLDVVVERCLKAKERNKNESYKELISLLLFMVTDVDEVQAIALKFLSKIIDTQATECEKCSFSNANKIEEMSCFKGVNKKLYTLKKVLMSPILLEVIVAKWELMLTGSKDDFFAHNVVTALWMILLSRLLMRRIITADKVDYGSLFSSSSSIWELIESGDAVIASCAFQCYSVFFFERISANESRGDLNNSTIVRYTELMFQFADPDADIEKRRAVLSVFRNYYKLFGDKFFIKNYDASSIWILPLRLLSDDDSDLREEAVDLVWVIERHVKVTFCRNEMPQPLGDEFKCVPMRAQERLLSCYINMWAARRLDFGDLYIMLLAWKYSALFEALQITYQLASGPCTSRRDEEGIFESTNPNPFYQPFIFAQLLAEKLHSLKKMEPEKLKTRHRKLLRNSCPLLPSRSDTVSFDFCFPDNYYRDFQPLHPWLPYDSHSWM